MESGWRWLDALSGLANGLHKGGAHKCAPKCLPSCGVRFIFAGMQLSFSVPGRIGSSSAPTLPRAAISPGCGAERSIQLSCGCCSDLRARLTGGACQRVTDRSHSTFTFAFFVAQLSPMGLPLEPLLMDQIDSLRTAGGGYCLRLKDTLE